MYAQYYVLIMVNTAEEYAIVKKAGKVQNVMYQNQIAMVTALDMVPVSMVPVSVKLVGLDLLAIKVIFILFTIKEQKRCFKFSSL